MYNFFSQGVGISIGICVDGNSQKPSARDCNNLAIKIIKISDCVSASVIHNNNKFSKNIVISVFSFSCQNDDVMTTGLCKTSI